MKNCVLRVIIALSTIHPSLNDNEHNLWQTGYHEGETSEVSAGRSAHRPQKNEYANTEIAKANLKPRHGSNC